MSQPKKFPKARLIIALMYSENPELVIKDLEKKYGEFEKSDIFNFNFTDFYEKEFGKNLKKFYMAFKENFDVENLSNIKHECFKIEEIYFENSKRKFNIDPGYITENSVVFASFKQRPHRISLNKNVYADLQLVYENNKWKSFKWTFPDIKQSEIKGFLKKIKENI